jgi:CHRD domain
MRRTTLVSALSLAVAGMLLSANVAVANGRGEERINVNLRGFEEVPVVVSGGSGQLHLDINDAAGTIAYSLSYQDLEGTVTQAHIHIGQKSVAGGIALWLCQTATNPAPAGAGTVPTCPGPNSGTVSGTLTADNVIGPTGQAVPAKSLDDVLTAIHAGLAYGNVHSTVVPGGEVRGQLRNF